jgi:hypothetical protein
MLATVTGSMVSADITLTLSTDTAHPFKPV